MYSIDRYCTAVCPYINLLQHLQLGGLDLRHEELHALLAVLVQQTLRMLVHGGTALATQSAQNNAETLRLARLKNLTPIKKLKDIRQGNS